MTAKTSQYKIRLQIMVFHTLVAEAIVEDSHEADTLWAKWCNLRYKRNESMGGAAIQRADICRTWDIEVGEVYCGFCRGVCTGNHYVSQSSEGY